MQEGFCLARGDSLFKISRGLENSIAFLDPFGLLFGYGLDRQSVV